MATSIEFLQHAQQQMPDGRWIPARELPGPFIWRIRDAWLVLTGKADAIVWPKS